MSAKMFTLAALLGLSGWWVAAADTNRVSLAWDASPDDVEGYRLYYGPVSGTNYTGFVDTTNLTASVSNLASGMTYFFVVTAYVTNYDSILLESEPSNEARYQSPVAPNAPSISVIGDVITRQNTPTPLIPFTLADPDSPVAGLSLFADSSNTNLLSQAGILFGGADANRTIAFNPSLNQTGKTTVILKATDGTATSSVAFVVSVNPPLTANTFSVPNVFEDLSVQIPLGASEDTPLTFVVVTNPSFGSLTLVSNVATYTPNPGFNGLDSFSYLVYDGISTSAVATVAIPVAFVGDLRPFAFTNDVSFAAGPAPQAIVAADFLKDYKVDLVVANWDNSTVSLLRGYTGGTFSNVYTLAVGSQPVALALGDFNKDNRQDLAVLCAGAKTVQIYLNTGATIASNPATALVLATNIALAGTNPIALVAMDFNKDLYVDMAVLDGGNGVTPGSVEVFMHKKSVAAPVFDLTNSVPVGVAPTAITAGAIGTPVATDKPDILVANGGNNTISVLVNVGYGLFTNLTNIVVGAAPSAIELGDLNGDKVTDIVVANGGSDDITVITNAGKHVLKVAGSFGVPQGMPTLGLKPKALALANFVKTATTETKLDVAVLMQEPGRPQGHVAVLRGNGTNSLNGAVPVLEFFWFDPGAYYEVGAEPVAMVTADFNGDRLPDLAVVNSGSDDVSILLNNWTPKAYNQKVTVIENYPSSIVLGGTYGPLDYIIAVQPTNGTITPSNGLVNLTTNPVLLYRPPTNESGPDLMKYYVSDGFKTSKWATVAITILPVNQPPTFTTKVGNNGIIEVAEDVPVRITNFITSVSPGPGKGEAKQTVSYFFKPASPSLLKGRAGQPMIVGTNRVLVFIPTNNVFGQTLVDIWAKDSGRVKTSKPDLRPYGEWDTSITQKFTIRITNVNDAPYFTTPAQVGPKTTYEDRGTNWVFNVWDIDSGIGSLALTVNSTNTALLDPLNGSQLTWTKVAVPGTNLWRVTVNVNPAADQFGKSLLTFTISDGTNSSSKSALLTVLAVNDQPDFVLATNSLTVSSPNVDNTVTNRIVDIAASQARLGPPNETNVQKFVLFKVLVPPADMPKLTSLPAINPLTGDLIVRTRKSASTQVIPLSIYAMDSGGVLYGGVNTSAVQTVTLRITP